MSKLRLKLSNLLIYFLGFIILNAIIIINLFWVEIKKKRERKREENKIYLLYYLIISKKFIKRKMKNFPLKSDYHSLFKQTERTRLNENLSYIKGKFYCIQI